MCYSIIGFTVSVVIGQMSLLTGDTTQIIDVNLLIPFFQSRKFKEEMRQKPETRYVTIDQMLVEMMKQTKNDSIDDEKSSAN